MKYLSLKESKKIIIEFLKHLNRYNKARVDKYLFRCAHYVPPKTISLFKGIVYAIEFFKLFLTASPKLSKPKPSLYGFLGDNEEIIHQRYSTFLRGSLYNFEENPKFWNALATTLKENNIEFVYGAGDNWNTKDDGKIIYFFLNDVIEGLHWLQSVWNSDAYVFTKDFSFLMVITHDMFIEICSSQKLISDLKKNYPDYRLDLNL